MSTDTQRANARGLPEAPANAIDEDREILDLRTEFERLDAMRRPLIHKDNELDLTFRKRIKKYGIEAAMALDPDERASKRLAKKLNPLDARAEDIMERMLALLPKTLDGIAAVAATLKNEELANYWNTPEDDRDFDVRCITRFLDGLIALAPGRSPEAADRVLAEKTQKAA
jgi:hypothetical protein